MDSLVTKYISNYQQLTIWINNSIDEIRNNLSVITYPVFVYLYLELSKQKSAQEARPFFLSFKDSFLAFSQEINELSLLKDPLNNQTGIAGKYLNNKVHIYIPKIVFDVFMHFLSSNNLDIILQIINKYFQKSSILSKVKDNNFVLLNLTADEIDNINCRTSIYTSKINSEDLNIKLKKIKGDKSILHKNIIPIPGQYFYLQSLDNTCTRIEQDCPPTIGCFTVLNTSNKMNCSDFSEDGGIIAIGMKDGSITVWILDNKFPDDITQDLIDNLQKFKDDDYDRMQKGGEVTFKISDDLPTKGDEEDNLAWDNIIKKRRQFSLIGHSDSVYSLSISTDKKYLLSGGYDETIRLWSLLKKQALIVYKGHFSPVLSVKFSPLTHYFASGGCDKTAKLWGINSSTPLRVFVGHLSDVEIVEFHPNGLYLATSANDSTVRLWSLENGECIRVIYNYSNKSYVDAIAFTNSGKLLTIACGQSLIIYDLIKMGDPIRIIDNMSTSPIYSISFDMDDSVLAFSTEDYKLSLFDFHFLLNDQLPIRLDLQEYEMNNINDKSRKNSNLGNYINSSSTHYLASYLTKKTVLLKIKFTTKNILLTLGRFDDNDPKIFI